MILNLILLVWLAVCAWQDWRSREVSNMLTLPPLIAAPVYAALQGWERLLLFALVGLAGTALFRAGGMGGADVKILLTLSAFAPPMLVAALAAQGIAGLIVWLTSGRRAAFPAVPAYAAGAVLSFVFQFFLPNFTGGLS
jgi:Flp pilus assembly protein protease CpaA